MRLAPALCLLMLIPTQGLAQTDTPDTSPDRFQQIETGEDEQAVALARQAEAERIAAITAGFGPPEVYSVLIPFNDGRRMLVTDLCQAAFYGASGCGTVIDVAAPGVPGFSHAYATSSVQVWLDLQQGIDGWPDLYVQDGMGVAQPFGIWRWSGAAYVHLQNLPTN